MSEWRFRNEVRPEDCEIVRALATATEKFRENEIAVAVELVQARLEEGHNCGYHFVFADDFAGCTIGYVCYGPIEVTLHGYDIYWIIVSPDQQRRGLGRALLEEAERLIAAAGGRQVYLETSGREDYLSTRNFYERAGYSAESLNRDFYAPGDDRLIYVRRLAGTPS